MLGVSSESGIASSLLDSSSFSGSFDFLPLFLRCESEVGVVIVMLLSLSSVSFELISESFSAFGGVCAKLLELEFCLFTPFFLLCDKGDIVLGFGGSLFGGELLIGISSEVGSEGGESSGVGTLPACKDISASHSSGWSLIISSPDGLPTVAVALYATALLQAGLVLSQLLKFPLASTEQGEPEQSILAVKSRAILLSVA